MRLPLLITAAMFALPALGFAEELKTRVLVADLNGDGTMEKIVTRKFATREEGDYYYLAVLDDEGKSVWTGPKEAKTDNQLVFGNWDFGSSLPELLVDLDADGAHELIARAPVSDVSPVSFRVLRWSKDGFKPVRVARLMEMPRDSGMYPWSNSEEYMGRWISAFNRVADNGQIDVEITDYREGETMRAGSALVMPVENGFKVQRWLKPMKPVGTGEEAPPEKAAAKDTGKPDASLARYMCQIGDEDMKNTRGERLKTVGEVLAQDRANFHKYRIRHRRDIDEESYFSTPERRQLFYQLPIQGPDSLKQWIQKGGAIVVVTVYSDRIVLSQE